MPGNEVAEKVHNYFEQDSASQNQHQSHVPNANWPVFNNPWVQRQNGTALSPAIKTYNLQGHYPERGNGWQSSRLANGADPPHSLLRPEFVKSQFRNPQNVNGYVQSSRTGPKQVEFQGGDVVRNLPVIGLQQANAPEQGLVPSRNSEGVDVAEAPVNFDFFGSQPQVMRSQQSGGPQAPAAQQSGLNDMQMWQQQLMYKQFQELQRQHQLQIDQQVRQQNSLSQLSAVTRHTTGDHLPGFVNGAATAHNPSNNMWPTEVMGTDPKLSNASHVIGANTGWVQRGTASPSAQGFANGLMYPQDQSLALRSMGFVPQQQLDQSLYGTPVACGRASALSHFSHLEGPARDGSNILGSTGGNQVDRQMIQSATFNSFDNDQLAAYPDQVSMSDRSLGPKQGFQGKNLFGQIPLQTFNNGVISGNLQQANHHPRNTPTQEFPGRQNDLGWAGCLEEKPATQVGSSQGNVSLDPTEERILYSSDEGIWRDFGRSGDVNTAGFMQGNQQEGSNYLNAFPSLQSGSWSALMQSAVAEGSSSDTGIHEEWSGLCFQKGDMSTGKHPSMEDNNVHHFSLTSKHFPSFGDSSAISCGIQQSSTKFTFEQNEGIRTDTSNESLQRSPQGGRWLDRRVADKHSEGSVQGQSALHVNNASEGARRVQMYEQSRNTVQHADMELNVENMQGPWTLQRNVPAYSSDGSKANGWNINEAFSLNGEVQASDHRRSLHVDSGNDGLTWRVNDSNLANIPFSNSASALEQKIRAGSPQGHGGDSLMNNFNSVTSSGNSKVKQDIIQDFQNNQQLEFEKCFVDLGNYQNQVGKGPQLQELSSGNSGRLLAEFDKKQDNSRQNEISPDSHMSASSHCGQDTVTGTHLRETTWLNRSDSHSLASGNQKFSGQVGRKAPVHRKFLYHPMGNEVLESAESTRNFSNSQALLQPSLQGKRSQEQGFYVQSKFAGQLVPDLDVDMEKKNMKEAEEQDPGTTSSEYDGSAGTRAANERTIQTSQNMLELLHKVDQSREVASTHFRSADHGTSDRPEPAGSDAPASHMHGNQSAAFGLRLGPPSQRQPMPNTQYAKDSSRHTDLDAGQKGQMLSGTGTAQPSPNVLDLPQGECWDVSNNTRHNISASSSTLLSSHNQKKIPGGSGQVMIDQSPSLSVANQSVLNSKKEFSSQFASPNSYDGASAGQSAQASLRVPSGGVSHFGLSAKPLSDTSQLQHLNGSSSLGRSSAQPESIPVLQQGGAFSKMLHNVWTSVPSLHHGSQQHKIASSPYPSSGNMETALWTTEKADARTVNMGGNQSPDVGACTVNSQQLTCSEEREERKNGTLQSERFELTPKTASEQQLQEHPLSSPLVVNSVPLDPSQIVSTQTPDIAMAAFGRSLRPSNLPHQNYSLLHQMQAMRDAEADASRKSGKRLKGVDPSPDTQPLVGKTGQSYLYGFGSVVRDSVDNDNSSDGKMLCFSSEVKEDHTAQPPVVDTSSKNYSSHLGIPSTTPKGTGDSPAVNPRMAPSWFERYGSFKNGQMLAMYDGLDSLRRNAKIAAQQFFFGKGPEILRATSHSTGLEQVNGPSTSGTTSELFPSNVALDVVDHGVTILRPKKRKTTTSELLPWHREVTEGLQRLQAISEAELDWAQATNRRAEKLEDEAEMCDDVPTISRPRRRLVLTTQLMQQLLRSIPTRILSTKATVEYETVTFFAARLALGDACNLICSLGSDSHVKHDNGNTASEKCETSGSVAEHFYSKVIQEFVGRAQKLENEFLRLDKRSSILDLRVECQDVERFSIINRFARFLSRGNADGTESSSSAEMRRFVPQRYVTAIAMPTPRNLPEGVLCLSL